MRGIRRCLLLAALSAGACDKAADHAHPDSVAKPGIVSLFAKAPDFVLSDQHGRRFRLSDELGKPVVLFFGYTHCPDVCPTVLSAWALVEKRLGERRDDVTFAFITVDPERDTPESMAQHLGAFSERFRGLVGTEEELRPVYLAYGIAHKTAPLPGGAKGFLIDHSTQIFLIDSSGKLVQTFDYRANPEIIASAVSRLLK